MKIVASFANFNDLNESKDPKINEQKKFLFLRRVCLAEYFLIDIEVSQREDSDDMINWEEVLSLQNLSERYNWNFESINDFQFKPFSFMKFPKQFLRFACEPFKFNIQSTENASLFSIIDYNYLINNYDELSGEIVQDENMEMMKNKKNLVNCDSFTYKSVLKSFYGKKFYHSVLIHLASSASQIIIVDQSNSAILDTFYLDKYGCTDIEYERSQPLFFNEEKYKKLIDVVLSGDFAYHLKKIY